MKISFIGGGTMGEAIIKCLLVTGTTSPQEISVHDISASRRKWLCSEYGINSSTDASRATHGADIIILAVKPQDMAKAIEGIEISSGQLVLSIIAGISLSQLRKGLNCTTIVRAMPNMPAQIGKGMTIWTATPRVKKKQIEMAQSILSSLGQEIYVTDEKYLDMATAVSGSGPAYVFLFIESLVDAGVRIGLPRKIAEKLVLQTVLGSAQTVAEMGKHPAELRNMVTSPGGTTAEALFQMEKGNFRSIILEAITAAYNKARSLSRSPEEETPEPGGHRIKK
jgi:pyrroline-5-carboxylate reductase